MLRVENTLTRKRGEFKPLAEGRVGVYVCGPTVYGHSHIGHAKSYVSFDVIVRYLRYLGYNVLYVQNITDVGHLTDDADQGEDKVIAEARRRGLHPMAVADFFTRSYYEDMDAMNVLRPDIAPRASGHIPEQVDLVSILLDKGYAYEVSGNVYFDVTSFPGYGKLSGKKLDELEAGARVDVNEEKRNHYDFALWKKADPGHIMQWNSPWGKGYPGWHLECSVMSMKYLGDTLDIHGGGLENVFPHHENEIAQSEAATGKPYALYWLHNNMVTVDSRKMGKSLGNFITLKQAFAGEDPLETAYRPLVIRYFILTSHYRHPLDFSGAALLAAEKGLTRLESVIGDVRRLVREVPDGSTQENVAELMAETRSEFVGCMDEDFNTAGALGQLNIFARKVRELLDSGETLSRSSLVVIDDLFSELGGRILGIVDDDTGLTAAADLQEGLIESLIAVRDRLREKKDFELSDNIRDRLLDMGVKLKDGAGGTKWTRG